MTNKDIVNHLTTSLYTGCQSISKEMHDFIRENYCFSAGNNEGKFYKVYCEGTDAKYNHYMVNPVTMIWRNSTFDEFYGGGIVD